MKYRAKCNGCGQYFLIEAQGKRELKCSCPYCAKSLTVCLAGETGQVRRTADEKKGERRGMKIFITALVVVVIGVFAGCLSWYLYQQNVNERQLADKLKAARRKAHQDSLIQIRAARDARRLGEEQQVIKEKSVENFLKSFCLDAVMGNDNVNVYGKCLTEKCREVLREAYGQDRDVSESFASWIFARDRDNVDMNSLRRNLLVSHYVDDWYRIRLVRHGETEYKYVKVIFRYGEIMIDDVR